jgi:hypothetical protein
MRKELVWAGVIGILFGVVIGFGVWRIKTSMVKDIKPTATPISKPGKVNSKITIDKPGNLDVITQNSVNVTGITKPSSWVVVSTEKGDYLTKSLEDGTFSAETGLEAGVNYIQATSVSDQGEALSQKILAIYSSSFQTAQSATSGASIDEAVELKISQAQNPPKAYLGVVTDIADSTIQIKTADSQIQQVATDKYNVTVVNSKGTSTKTVKLTDIAIGDFIIAMGYVDGDDVLDVQRILVADSLSDTKLSVSLLKTETVSKKSLALSPINGGDIVTITPDKNTSIRSYSQGKFKSITISAITKSDLIILVSDDTGTPSVVRSIFVVGQ